MALAVRKSNPNKPVRIMAYGVEGVGKSTLGAKSDKPIFLSPEGGSDQLTDANGNPVEELTGVSTWDGARKAVKDLINEKHDYKTLVVDSADWIEKLCHAHIVGNSGKSITTCNGGYGAGYRQSELLHKEFIEDISQLREKRGMNIIILAHAHVKAVKDPSMNEDYDSFEIKCHDMVSSLYREWVDGLFFVRFRTFIKSSDDTVRARALSDGTRVLFTVKQPSFQAKNRFGMLPEYTFTENFWNEFVAHIKKTPVAVVDASNLDAIRIELNSRWEKLTDANIKSKVQESVLASKDDVTALTKILEKLRGFQGEAA